ncbi:MIP family channel protein [Seiridium cupressi]
MSFTHGHVSGNSAAPAELFNGSPRAPRTQQGPVNPPSALSNKSQTRDYASEHGSDTGTADTSSQQGRERPNKRLEFANNPPLEHITSQVSVGNHVTGPQSAPLSKTLTRTTNGHSGHGYADLEQGLGPVSTQDTYTGTERSANHDDDHLNKEEREGGRAVRPQMFSRTFTQQIRNAGQDPELDFQNLSKEEKRQMMRLPWSYLMDTKLKNDVVAALGEFVGTTMFLFFAFIGTGVANIPAGTGGDTTTTGVTGFDIGVQTYIALCFGFSLMVNAWVFYRISGGLFNPAVTLALVLIRAMSPVRGLFVFAAQAAGGIAAAGLAQCMFPTPLNVSTTLAPGVNLAQGVFIEAILTFELVFTIFMLAAEKHRATFVAPVGIGLALFIAELGGVYYTGGSLNPARSLGPCVVAANFQPEHWIYWVGPFIGTLVAVGFYKVIKALQYETVNPGQDSHE